MEVRSIRNKDNYFAKREVEGEFSFFGNAGNPFFNGGTIEIQNCYSVAQEQK